MRTRWIGEFIELRLSLGGRGASRGAVDGFAGAAVVLAVLSSFCIPLPLISSSVATVSIGLAVASRARPRTRPQAFGCASRRGLCHGLSGCAAVDRGARSGDPRVGGGATDDDARQFRVDGT